eukprot:15446555-Alexandrium_andersonii.AAC.1
MTHLGTTATAEGAAFRCAMPGLTARLARRQIRNIADHLQHHNLTIGQHEVRTLPAGPDKRETVTHAAHTHGNDIRSTFRNVGFD